MKTQSGTLWLCLRFYLFILIKVELIYKAVLVSMSPSKYYHNKQYEKLTWNNTNKTLCTMSLPNWGMIYDLLLQISISSKTEPSLPFMVISQITGVKFSLTLFPTTLQYETLKEKNQKTSFHV